MPCDFCAGPGQPGHRYGSLLCQRGAHALRRGVLGWSHAHIADCRLVCPECGRRHDTFHSFEACLDSHGIFMGWGVPKHRDGTVYRRGPGAAYLVARGHTAVVDRAALEQRFLGDGKVLRRRKAVRELVCREDGLDDEVTPGEVAEWMAYANRYLRKRKVESGGWPTPGFALWGASQRVEGAERKAERWATR